MTSDASWRDGRCHLVMFKRLQAVFSTIVANITSDVLADYVSKMLPIIIFWNLDKHIFRTAGHYNFETFGHYIFTKMLANLCSRMLSNVINRNAGNYDFQNAGKLYVPPNAGNHNAPKCWRLWCSEMLAIKLSKTLAIIISNCWNAVNYNYPKF